MYSTEDGGFPVCVILLFTPFFKLYVFTICNLLVSCWELKYRCRYSGFDRSSAGSSGIQSSVPVPYPSNVIHFSHFSCFFDIFVGNDLLVRILNLFF